MLRTAGFVITTLLCLSAAPVFSQSFEKPSFIQWQVAGIRAETDPNIRRAKSEYLLHSLNESRAGESGDADIDALASLLPDKDVQAYMAMALGKIGPRAGRAVPALVAAIAEWHNQVGTPRTGVWAPSLMCNALVQIDFSQRPADCADW